ncbi:DNA repair protein RecO [Thalassomonas sp. M1454]|uniref:DNA repair protein RecO n=1 Tax=Thalassomonas sp. M1454 TaxID=2594477 RepID=UPI00117E98D6|nr:DNA repair protein RecO [Thalassomonas sp. M1454]TRX54526.1 DNA repair protein RecO [Thalassomonas sp. M1454]
MARIKEVVLHQAYLLHSRPYRDSSLLVDLLSEEHGHVSAVVYVGKSKKSNKKGLLQPFSSLQVELKGQNDLKTLSQIEPMQKSLQLSSKYLYSGFYLNELMVRLLPENIPCPQLFQLYQTSIQALAQQQSIEPVLRRFELSLLEELGMSLDFSTLEQDADSSEADQTLADDGQYLLANPQDSNTFRINEPKPVYWHFIPEQGFIRADGTLNFPSYKQLHLQQIGHGNFSDANVLLTCKQLMRQVLQLYLGNKPLNSRKLFFNRLAK